jgi:hypothetical protein
MKNWKTTVCGIASGLFAGLALIGEMPTVWAKVFGVLAPAFASLGLIFSRDYNVTSEQSGLTPKTEPPK